jgi:hypothetical protein
MAGTGSGNTAVGYRTLRNNITGSYNVAVGDDALKVNTTGNWNVFLGILLYYLL